jgi:hypothetical protein
MTPNRIVALLTPVVAIAAGAASTWLADNISGLDIEAGQLEAIFLAGLAAVLAPAAQFLYGGQKYERHEQELERAALEADREAAEQVAMADVYADGEDYEEYDEYDEYDGDAYDEVPDDEDELYAAARDEDAEPVLPGS